MLNHALKECPDRIGANNQAAEECLQYGPWLRGDSIRRYGWGTSQTKARVNADFNQRANRDGMTIHDELTHVAQGDKGLDGSHMIKPLSWDGNLPMEISVSEAKGLLEALHENGCRKGGARKMVELQETVFRNWDPKLKPEASSCLMSLTHGTPAVIMATRALINSPTPLSFASPNASFQNFVLEYVVHHGAVAILVLLFLAEVTSACQNVRSLANLRRADVPMAAKVLDLHLHFTPSNSE
ncbi:hypothetical protein CMV_030149 [Castanea mollissima]|uniref:Uncharacterized protein n=1 Tax=Castanea mollissima TaxID=60419 RepID=A0A8J4VA57_9ROSI|nr:hypothetical protein CMV_030149 [Castanea mollissima]